MLVDAAMIAENVNYTVARVETRQGQDVANLLCRLKTTQEWGRHNAVYILCVCVCKHVMTTPLDLFIHSLYKNALCIASIKKVLIQDQFQMTNLS